MNRHRVLVLGVVTALALGAALWSNRTQQPERDVALSQPLVPGLEQDINEVSALRVRGPGDVLLASIRRTDAGWVLAEKDDYPVDANVLREYLLKLARAKRVEAKTDNPALYYKLGVEEISVKDHPGSQIEIDGLAQPVKLILGRNVPRGAGTYARHVSEAQSWQSDADLAVEKTPANWLQRELVDLASGRVLRVSVQPATGPALQIVRAEPGGGGDFALANLPKGREPASEFVADATAGLLSGLRFDDVLRTADAPAPAEGLTTARFEAEDGLVLALTAWKSGDATRATLAATLDEAVATTFVAEAQAKAVREHEALVAAASGAPAKDAAGAPAADAGDAKTGEDASPTSLPPAPPLASTDPAADREQRLAALRAQRDAMNARFEGKTFVLPSFKAESLNRTLEDYLKPKA